MLLITIFYEIDEFCKQFENEYKKFLIQNGSQKRNKPSRLLMSEMMTICIHFHFSGYKNFKQYYINHVCQHLSTEFPNLVSYTRFVELKQKVALPIAVFAQLNPGTCTGKSLIDSAALKVAHQRRIHSHKVFKGLAQRGKTSVGWFFGFKIHLTINEKGEILNFLITPGNVADNNEEVIISATKGLFGKIFGDKGYIINSELFQKLYSQGIQFITKLRSNMTNKLMPMEDKLFLKKRGLIETVIGILKEELSMEHSRHRSVWGFFSHIFSTLAAYVFKAKKPSLKRKVIKKLAAA
ncbi:MAG TPA: IS982 family transposase [Candidatus Babeliales bacterium]|nr:IS982 family transposase [Candidatus Babeliales bacterium]